MLLDHDNLLSTFGKDSQSSNRKNKQVAQAVKNKRSCLNYEIQGKNRYQQILSQRKTLMLQKKPIIQKGNRKQESKKLKTQSDIQDLNDKIRRSISGIAETICKSKIQSHQKSSYEPVMPSSSMKQLSSNINITIASKTKSSFKQPKAFESVSKLDKERLRSSRYGEREKENINYMNSDNNMNSKMMNNVKYSKSSNTDRVTNRNSIGSNINREISSNIKRENINSQKYRHESIRNDGYDRKQIIKVEYDKNKNSKDENTKSNKNLRNSTKKKTNFFESSNSDNYYLNKNNNNTYTDTYTYTNDQHFAYDNDCHIIKNSFSIDLNSQRHHDSIYQYQHQRQQSSRLHINADRNPSKSQTQSINTLKQQLPYEPKSIHRQSLSSRFSKKTHVSIGRENEDTLKKQFKQLVLVQPNYIQQPKLLQSNKQKSKKRLSISTQKQSTKLIHYTQRQNKQFLFSYQDPNYNNNINHNFNHDPSQQQSHQEKSPDFNSIEVPKKLTLNEIKKRIPIDEDKKQHHPLIAALMNQIQLDYDLRHAKHMFSGIEEPFTQKYDTKPFLSNESSKWQLLNYELNSRGLYYNVEAIKKIFLPSQEELDPFLSVTHPHDELIYSLIYAYQTAQIHWEQSVYKKWQHWDLRDIDLTIENIDRERKGYITVEDIAAFISMQTGKEYKNRDVILIYKRLINGFNAKSQSNSFQSNTFQNAEDKSKLKFRSLIDCLIKNF